MKSEILVTVIVPAYNHEKYVIECLDSIDNQTYKNFQWIVVDDGSIDSTPQILIDNKEKYGYELILHKYNMGLSATLTDTIIRHSVGKYISICASDDFWLPNKIEKQVSYMEYHPDCALCYGNTYYVDNNSTIIGNDEDCKYEGGMIFEKIITQEFHPPVNYMYRLDVLRSLGYFRMGVIAEDFYMNCLISANYPIGYIPMKLGYYRVEELIKKRDPLSVYLSHEETINMFRNCPIYRKAITLHYIRCFRTLSSYKKHKFNALKFLFRCYPQYIKVFPILSGFYHWFFTWK